MLCWFFLLFSLSALSTDFPSEMRTDAFAKVCMQHTVNEKDWPTGERSVCRWIGMTCQLNIPWKLRYRIHDPEVISFDWLPPTLRKIYFSCKFSRKSLDTRKLPKNLLFCYMSECDINGEVDLQALPTNLEFLALPVNRISGTVFLCDLPRNIRAIDIAYNPIKAYVIDDSNMPASLQEVFIRHPKGQVRGVHVNQSPEYPKIKVQSFFLTMKRIDQEFFTWET